MPFDRAIAERFAPGAVQSRQSASISGRENFGGLPGEPGSITGFDSTGTNYTPSGTKLEYYFYEFVNTLLLVAAKDPRISEIARIFNTYRFSIRTIAKEAGLSHTAINHWLRSADPRPRQGEKVDDVLRILRREEQKFSTSDKNSRQSDTKTPYNTSSANLDSAQLQQLHSLTEKVQIEVQVTPVDKPWSAKGVQTKMASSSAFPGAAGRPIQVDGALGDNILPGQVVIFRPKEDDYIVEDLYMIFEHKDDADQSVIGWFDPQKDSRMIQTMGGPMPVSEWKATHEAFAVMWGKFGELTEYRISTKGIGPTTRL